MTSASELFTARRAARGGRLSDPDPDPDPHADALRDQHGLGGRRRRRGCRPRRQLDAAGDDQILSYIDNNNIGDSAARRNRLDRLMFRTNERLPGAVLQAQARVLERLRGISLEIGKPGHEANRPHSSSFHPSSESDEERPTISSSNSNRSAGLSKAAFLRLQIEIFEASKDDKREASPECSICLDGFYDGDELIRLRCGHRFHSTCLEPWVRKCADCPYCRTNIRSRS
ncbi:unnamed protein product [Miscanthus lutarioriparius]|uniref:RING-type domain-containing protein n=1 Tax=Miscanthus lutarioriparius TaxID=422564 RepID=A0A811MNK3_9POAL|nr:unnamed protein product [Miscanthus lutarioriparius]